MELKIVLILLCLVFTSNSSSSCFLSESGPHPYLVRISDTSDAASSSTYGHGSLVKENKVLSTCTPFKGLSEDLKETNWTLIGYNFEKRCKQQRNPLGIVMHNSCRSAHPPTNGPISHDFALWTVEAFDMEGLPFLWGNGKPHPAPWSAVETIINNLLKYPKSLSVGLFRIPDSDGPELQSYTKVIFIDWFVCFDMLRKFTSVAGDLIDGLDNRTSSIEGFHKYFCGYDVGIKWIDDGNLETPFNSDWYSGAAVMYEDHSGKVPIGIFSRGISVSSNVSNSPDSNNFRIIMGIHREVYGFLSENGIEPEPEKTPGPGYSPHLTRNRQTLIEMNREDEVPVDQTSYYQSSATAYYGLWIQYSAFAGIMFIDL